MPRNAITDVPGVRVGHSQAESGEPTGVTVVAPPALPAPAGTAVVNGMGELTGRIEIDERGAMETPLYLCGSHAVGIVHHAAVLASGRGPENIVLPVVGECDDSWRADSRTGDGGRRRSCACGTRRGRGRGNGRRRHRNDVLRVSRAGSGPRRGVVGEHHVGVLLLCNFGDREYLDLLGTHLDPPSTAGFPPAGSCIAVCATDAPMGPHQLRRMALRPLLGPRPRRLLRGRGLGRDRPRVLDRRRPATLSNDDLDPYFIAAWEAAQEAVYNCLVAAEPGALRDGTMQDAFPVELRARAGAARRG